MIHFANVGHNIYIGNREACELGQHGMRTLHIGWSEMPQHLCQYFLKPRSGDLTLDYLDGHSLEQILGSRGNELRGFFQSSDPVFIHCFAGTYRSPTLAILAKGFRGGNPFMAMGEIASATRSRYGLFPHFHDVPVSEICKYLGY